MKLSARDAARFLDRPDPGAAGVLLYGPDAMRVALKRQALLAALLGPGAAEEMRLARMPAADLRRDPAALVDALKATGFFPGPRAVLVEEAGDGQAAAILAGLGDWRQGDATLVVAAGDLKASSALRKGFEGARGAVAIGVHADPPDRAEIEAAVAKAGIGAPDRAALADLDALGRALDPGDFAQFLEKLALYKLADPGPLTSEEIAAVAPPPAEAEAEAILDDAAEGRPDAIAAALSRLGGGASAATGLVIAAGRRFRTLHAAACASDGPEAALATPGRRSGGRAAPGSPPRPATSAATGWSAPSPTSSRPTSRSAPPARPPASPPPSGCSSASPC